MAKALAKFWAASPRERERDVDRNHCSPIAPSKEATPTEPMHKTRRRANMIGWHVVFNNLFAGGAKEASAQHTLVH